MCNISTHLLYHVIHDDHLEIKLTGIVLYCIVFDYDYLLCILYDIDIGQKAIELVFSVSLILVRKQSSKIPY